MPNIHNGAALNPSKGAAFRADAPEKRIHIAFWADALQKLILKYEFATEPIMMNPQAAPRHPPAPPDLLSD